MSDTSSDIPPVNHTMDDVDVIVRETEAAIDAAARDMRTATDTLIAAMTAEKEAGTKTPLSSSSL